MMRLLLVSIFSIWIVLLGIVLHSVNAVEEPKEENPVKQMEWTFENTEVSFLPENWRIAENNGKGNLAKWEVTTLEDAPSGKHALALTETQNPNPTFNLALAQNALFKDLVLTVQVKAISGQMDQGGGPIWRVQDPDNYYIARWNPLEDNLRVYHVKDSKRTQIASMDIQADASAWHKIEISMIGKRITAKFDDKKMLEVEDQTFPEVGMVGLWTKADAATAFDDLRVEEKTQK